MLVRATATLRKASKKKLDGDRYKKSRKQDNGSTFALFFGPGHSRSEKKRRSVRRLRENDDDKAVVVIRLSRTEAIDRVPQSLAEREKMIRSHRVTRT